MSIRKKITIFLMSLILIVLIVNNAIHYFHFQNQLNKLNQRESLLMANLIAYQVNNAMHSSKYIEDLLAKELRSVSIAIREQLPPDYHDVTNQQLKDIADELMVSDITLFAERGNDIVGVRSSDPREINLSTKNWGYWRKALEQLLAMESVHVEAGLTLPQYWSGPFERGSSDPNHINKWGYYYDGSTNYIINPYIRNYNIIEFKKFYGPDKIIEDIIENYAGFIEIAVINPEKFKNIEFQPDIGKFKLSSILDEPILYGSYNFINYEKDKMMLQKALTSDHLVSYRETIDQKDIQKYFLAIDTPKTKYVISIVYDYGVIKNKLYTEASNFIIFNILYILGVLLISAVYSKTITSPLTAIANAIKDISKGNYSVHLPIKNMDEIGILAYHVNHLSTTLETNKLELEKSQKLIKHQAFHDPLTNLPNRRYLEEKMNQMINIKTLEHNKVAVAFLDSDRFKNVNDSLGHAVGDLLIKLIAQRIREYLSEINCIIARQGGNEFIILFKNYSEENVISMVEQLIQYLAKPYYLLNEEIYLGISCGISFFPNHTLEIEELISFADQAMYVAKREGGNKAVVYNPDMMKSKKELPYIETRLRRAIESNLIDVFYQAQFNARLNKLIGVEALSRWNDIDLGYQPPNIFIPIAEEAGLMQELFELVLNEAIQQVKKWQNLLPDPLTLSINVSPTQFRHSKKLIEGIQHISNKHSFPLHHLEIELTENALGDETEIILTMKKLKKMGVLISIDDFGTGYSSFSSLNKLPFNKLKIDQSFVKNIKEDGSNKEIPETIIQLGRILKLDVIAEGVEEEYQKEILLDIGCEKMQGYLFSKPLPKEEFNQFLKTYIKNLENYSK